MLIRSLTVATAILALTACSPSYQAVPVQQPVQVVQPPAPYVVVQPTSTGSNTFATAALAAAAGYAVGSYHRGYGYVDHYDNYGHPVYTRNVVTHVTHVTHVHVNSTTPSTAVVQRSRGINLSKSSSTGSARAGRAIVFHRRR